MLQIKVRVTRYEIDIQAVGEELRADEFEILDDLDQQWPHPRKAIGRALRDAHLGREQGLIQMLRERGLEELVTDSGTLVRDWHEQLQAWLQSWASVQGPIHRHERYPDHT